MLHFRVATAHDSPALAALVNSAYRGDTSRAGWTTEADLLDGQRIDAAGIDAILGQPGQSLHMACDEAGQLVGCVHTCAEDDGSLYFGMLTVLPTGQRRGVGGQLLGYLRDLARGLGCWRLRMTVIQLRPELIAWYERQGFVATGRELPFPMDDPRFGLPRVPLLVLREFERRLG